MRRWPTLLFVTPILPAQTGNGLAMRAGVFLDAFAQDFAVTLLVVPVAGGAPRPESRFVAERTLRVVVVPLEGKVDPLWTLMGRIADADARNRAFASYPRPAMCRYATARYLADVTATLAGGQFDVVHVLRSYMAPYAEPFLPVAGSPAPPFASLDLDDDEAAAHARLTGVAERAGVPVEAQLSAAEAAKYTRHESLWLPGFQLLVTCTEAHAAQMLTVYPRCRTAVVPNTVVLPTVTPPHQPPGQRILFVGNLSYPPNVDGISHFAREIFPRLRAEFGDGASLRIAGSAPTQEVAALVSLPGIELVADPPELATHYAWADLVVIPLAAGGGTRIKLIEAFAHGVPVVATAIGAEGVAAEHGVHLLIADAPRDFAAACASVLSDIALARRLSVAARGLAAARYAHEHGVRAIRGAFGTCPEAS